MSMIDIPIAHIRRQAKPRPLNQTAIRSIAESFQSTGQISPIVVKKDHPMIGMPEDRYMLISGNHRLSAAESLGWATIKASVVDKETHPIHLELIEVDENLCRAELTPAEKAMAVKKRKILWDSLREQQGNSGTQSSTIRGPGMPQGFATSTAAAIGMSKQKVNDYLRIADQLGELLDEIKGTEFDNKAKLLDLARLSHDARMAMLQAIGQKADRQEEKLKRTPAPPDPDKVMEKVIRLFSSLPSDYQRVVFDTFEITVSEEEDETYNKRPATGPSVAGQKRLPNTSRGGQHG